MKLGFTTNGFTHELEMQKEFCKWLDERKFKYIDEFSAPEVHRRADFLVLRGGQLINIEAKSTPSSVLVRQMKDHAKYCDYSFVFIIDYSFTPKWFKKLLVTEGWGLIIYNKEKKVITEVLESHINKGIDKDLKKTILKRFRKRINYEKAIKTQTQINW